MQLRLTCGVNILIVRMRVFTEVAHQQRLSLLAHKYLILLGNLRNPFPSSIYLSRNTRMRIYLNNEGLVMSGLFLIAH